VEVDWVVFDAVGTVIRPEPSIAVAYHAIGSQFGSDRTVDDVRSRFATAFAETERIDLANGSGLATNASVEEARWRHVVSSVFPEIADAEACFQELHDYFALPSAWSLFEDTAPALKMLRDGGVRLAIASNFDHRLHSICDGTPALTLFEKRYVSSELGYRKPSDHFFREMITDLNVVPDRVLMVGDSIENDVEGALAIGMRASLIARENSHVATDQVAGNGFGDRASVIQSLAELEGLLT
jgi:putative hydrolase of the HAD superfamily